MSQVHRVRDDASQHELRASFEQAHREAHVAPAELGDMSYFLAVGRHQLVLNALRDSANVISRARARGVEDEYSRAELAWLRGEKEDGPLTSQMCFETLSDLLRLSDEDALRSRFLEAVGERPGQIYSALDGLIQGLEGALHSQADEVAGFDLSSFAPEVMRTSALRSLAASGVLAEHHVEPEAPEGEGERPRCGA